MDYQKRIESAKTIADIFELAKEIAYLDIGQTVAVKDKAIVAVEALEGTDNLIRRAGNIVAGGITVVKVSKPKQDTRFDIPVQCSRIYDGWGRHIIKYHFCCHCYVGCRANKG